MKLWVIVCVVACMAAGMAQVRAADILPATVDWRARIIWHPTKGDVKNLYFRKTIDLPEDVQKCYFAGSCDDAFELFVNGRKIGESNRWDFIDFYRLGIFVHPGKNVVAVHCKNPIGSGAFGGQVVAETRGGRTLLFPTDASWKMSEVEAIEGKEGKEAKEAPGWTAVEFDDSAWVSPRVGKRFPQDGQWASRGLIQPERPDLVYATQDVAPVAIYASAAGAGVLENVSDALKADGKVLRAAPGKEGAPPEFIVDFGRQVVGYPVVQFTANARGALIEIAYGQSIKECVDAPNQGLQRVDLLTLDPGDVGRWVNPLVKGFRYARFIVRQADDPVEIDSISVLMYCYQGPQIGSFKSSDPLIDRIWDISTYSVRLCMQRDHYSDDIKRERTLWMGDMRPEAMTNYYAFRDYDLLKKCLPKLAGGGQVRDFLDYQCWWGITLSDYYRFSGDLAYVRGQEKNLEKCIAALEAHETKDGPAAGLLLRPKGSPEWCMSPRYGHVCMLQALWAGVLDRGAELKRDLGDEKTAAAWAARAEKIREQARKLFWDETAGAFADMSLDGKLYPHYTQDGNSLAVVFGIATPGQARRVSAFMAEHLHTPMGSKTVWPDYPATGPRIGTFISPFMTQFQVQAHFEAGDAKAAIECMRGTWGHMVSKDATTTWEAYNLDGEIPRPGVSLCHGWSGGPTWLLGQYVLGVRPLEPGFKTFLVSPRRCLDHVEGVVPVPGGSIAVSHSFTDKGYSGTLKFDGPGQADFNIPADSYKTIRINGRMVTPKRSERGLDVGLEPGDYEIQCE